MESFFYAIYDYGKSILKVFGMVLLWTFVSQVVPVVLISVGIGVEYSHVGMLVSLFSEIIGIITMCAYYRKTAYVMGPLKKKSIKSYLTGFLFGALTFSLIWIIIYAMGGYHVSVSFSSVNGFWLLFFLMGYAIQSFFEELLCRGFVMGYWLKQGKVVSAFLLNSLLFAFLHIGNSGFDGFAFIGIFLFGLLMSEIRFISGSIWVSGAFHAAWNFFEGSVFGTSVSGFPDMGLVIKSTNTTLSQQLTGGSFGLERSATAIIIYSILVAATLVFVIVRGKSSNLVNSK